MNEATRTVSPPNIVYRRLLEHLTLELSPATVPWYAIIALALVPVIAYLVWMYVREARSGGAPWAVFRAGGRCLATFIVICLAAVVPVAFSDVVPTHYGWGPTATTIWKAFIVVSLVIYHLGLLAYIVLRFVLDGKWFGWLSSVLATVCRIVIYVCIPPLFAFKDQLVSFTAAYLGLPRNLGSFQISDRLQESVFWGGIIIVVLLLGLGYTAWTYSRDQRTADNQADFVGQMRPSLFRRLLDWAFLLRVLTFGILAMVFLLPACQTKEETKTLPRILVLFDVTPSVVEVTDEPLRENVRFEDLPTRQDKVIAWLMKEVDLPGGEKSDFIKELQKRAPVYCSRFGRQWDDNYVVFTDGRHWWRDDWERLQRDGKEEETEGKKKEWLKANWEEWLRPRLKARPPAGLKEKDQEKWIAQLELDLRRFGATNIAESVQAAMQRESNNLVQAVILVSDGRSTEGTPQALRDLRDRLNQAHVPIFTIAVGEDRPRVKIDVASPLAPQQTRPEDPFPVTVDIQGEGLADQEIKVYLDITNPKGGDLILNNLAAPKSDKPGTDTKDQKPEQISLGKKITFEKTVRFGKGEGNVPPHVEVEFPIDVIKLMERAGKAVEPGMKLELGEGEWMFEVRVPRDKNENFPDPEHKSKNPRTMTVIKRPLRILLFAGAPTRDYQFCRSLFVREAEKKRVELCVYLQPVPGQVQERANIVQDVAPEQLLKSFPKYFGGDVKVEDRYYNLEYYDLIIGFDPDWSQLMPDELNLVKKWVEQGGGLIVEGGPVNTLQLARPGESRKKLKPILDLYPVVPKDIRIQDLDRKTDEPWRLRFPGVGVETEYLKLDDDDPKAAPLAGWEEFFGSAGEDSKSGPERGFYGYYPVEKAKEGSITVATFTDPRARLADGKEQPYLVTSTFGGRVVWIGSGETWRLRKYREAYHERFWTKLARFAGAGNFNKQSARVSPFVASTFKVRDYVPVEAQVIDKQRNPLGRDGKVKVTLTLPDGVPAKEIPNEYSMTPKAGSEGWFECKFQVKSPGKYKFDVTVESTGDKANGDFLVESSDPELDNTKPDFEQLYALASNANDVLRTATDPAVKKQIESRLRKPHGVKISDGQRLFFELKDADIIPSCLTTIPPNVREESGIPDDFWNRGLNLDREVVFLILGIVSSFLGLIVVGLGVTAIIMMSTRTPVHSAIVALFLASLILLLFVAPLVPVVHYYPKLPEISLLMVIMIGLLATEWTMRKLLKLA